MRFPYLIIERDHVIQNPTSAEKIRLLGEYVRLDASSRVLDVASGKGGPARVLAAAYGCRIHGIERQPEFADTARSLAEAEGLAGLIEVETADASHVALEPESYDVALCLGAAFVWGSIADAAVALRPAVRAGGFVAIGEPYWRRLPLPEAIEDEEGLVDFPATVARFEGAGLALTGLITASQDDWDRYESLHWRAAEEHLASHADEELREEHEERRRRYLFVRRELLGWAIFVGRK